MMEVILALIALAGNCGWIIDRQRTKQAARKLSAEADQASFELSRQYVQEFREQIFTPMAQELALLRNSLREVSNCPHQTDCPVVLHRGTGAAGGGVRDDPDGGTPDHQPADGRRDGF